MIADPRQSLRFKTWGHCGAMTAAVLIAVTSRGLADEEPLSFNRDIRPILADKCLHCHGPATEGREAGLRLDVRESALAELDSGETAIVPGDAKASALVARINATDEYERMPPVDTGKTLSQQQRDLLARWIQQGAVYQRHWAFVPPGNVKPPEVSQQNHVRSAIDRFVVARLQAAGLQPAAEADPYVLARRVALDVTGLPPALDEVERFVGDTEPGAYERYVDRLLASPAYGERWARVWLDLARYADSAGYAQDPARTIWRYRDWVIRSLNENMPFDQFTVEQLAGDMLNNPSNNQLIATAFHRNTMTNSEGGTDDEEFRNAAVVDRVNTTIQVWMGLTMGCAQCHDHKYDPISQEEYFRVFAIFNSTEDADRGNESPTLVTLTPEQEEKKKQLQAEIAKMEKTLAEDKAPNSTEATPPQGPIQPRFVRIELPGKQKILSLAEVQVFAAEQNVARAGKVSQVSTTHEGKPELAIDGNTNGDFFAATSTTHTAEQDDPWWEVDLGDGQSIDRIIVWNRTDGTVGTRLAGFRLVLLDQQRKPIWVTTIAQAPQPSVTLTPPASWEKATDADRKALASYLPGAAGGNPKANKKLAGLKKQLSAIKGIPTPIMRELPAGQRRKTHIQLRGSFLNKDREVTAGVPAAFHSLPENAEVNRLTFAHWLVDKANPLTARVVVNRYWEQLFGVGLVETSEDFGQQGSLPSHPALLDYLATELVRHDWDTKWLVRHIVTSATYRQSSLTTEEKLRKDPANRLLSRGPRFRLPAETIRDQALFVSGLLSRKMYGPSVQPLRPQTGLRAAFGGSTDWQTSPGEDRYRRGLYTSWRRTTPYPSMTTFDAPSREFCTVRRIRTNTPLQALVTLNDPVFVEAAQALARRIVREGGSRPDERAAYGFRLCMLRPPQPAELSRLVKLQEKARASLQENTSDATRLATEPLGPAPAEYDIVDLAAWTVVGNILLNLDELLARP